MNFGFLVFPGLEELDLIGPWEVVGMWGTRFNGPQNRLMIAASLQPVVCAKGLSLNPDVAMQDCPKLDYLLVPGGQGTRREVDNPELTGFIARQAESCRAVLSVCTGSFLLQKAGLLSGKRAATHWASLGRLREFMDVTVVEERFVQDGNIWTSAGVSAGIDMLLAFIASEAGEEIAGQVQLATEYYPSGRLYGNVRMMPEVPGYVRS